ncbi:MAG: hypothetical protein K1X31_10215 [Gemmatimonadaceae bacterium]|nr:hypothetical protein [Gemmatimonadaceae bacterium]
MTRAAVALALSLLAAPSAAAQKPAPAAGPPLAGFAALQVSVFPAQLWRADTTAWSRGVTWAAVRAAFDSTLQATLEERGLGRKWAYASDVVRIAKRNPTYASDPYALGVVRLRAPAELKAGDPIPTVLGDNLRPFTALGDTRYALIPIEVRAQGAEVVLRLVLVDTRSRTLTWGGELLAPGGPRMAEALAQRVADLIIEP